MSPTRPLTRLLALGAVASAALSLLVATGSAVPGPPLTRSLDAWTRWAGATGAAGMLMGTVRLAAAAATGYLLLVVAVELVGRRLDAPAVLRMARRLSRPWVRAVITRTAGVGLVASMAASGGLAAAPVAGATAPPPPVVMHRLGATGPTSPSPEPPGGPTGTRPPAVTAPGPSSITTPPSDPPTTSTPNPNPTASPSPTPTTPPAAAPTWTIRPGDHLWRVASATLATARSTPPDNAQISAYLELVIAANRDRLVVPGDADLVYPGQIFALPPVPAAPG